MAWATLLVHGLVALLNIVIHAAQLYFASQTKNANFLSLTHTYQLLLMTFCDTTAGIGCHVI